MRSLQLTSGRKLDRFATPQPFSLFSQPLPHCSSLTTPIGTAISFTQPVTPMPVIKSLIPVTWADISLRRADISLQRADISLRRADISLHGVDIVADFCYKPLAIRALAPSRARARDARPTPYSKRTVNTALTAFRFLHSPWKPVLSRNTLTRVTPYYQGNFPVGVAGDMCAGKHV